MTGKLNLAPGQTLTIEERMPYLMELQETLEQGYASLDKIAEQFGISKPTAREWRKAALKLSERDNNGFTREGVRNIQIGRIQYMIERLQKDLDALTDVELKAKLHDRIVKYYDSLARITGLNHEQILHQHQQVKPLQVIMHEDTSVSEGIVTEMVSDQAHGTPEGQTPSESLNGHPPK